MKLIVLSHEAARREYQMGRVLLRLEEDAVGFARLGPDLSGREDTLVAGMLPLYALVDVLSAPDDGAL